MKEKIAWDDVDQIKELVRTSTSRKEVLGKMGFNVKDSRQLNRINQFIDDNTLDISHFKFIPEKWKQLPDIISSCYCYSDILRKLKLSTHGSNTTTAKKFVEYYNLDTSHFTPTKFGNNVTRCLDQDIFCVNRIVDKSTVRKRFLKLVEYKCVECGISKWNNKVITLEMDHIDGDRYNHTLTNLRLLCPNCHSQTSTYGSKNVKK